LVRRPLLKAADPGVHVWVTGAQAARRFADEAHLSVGTAQAVTQQPFPVFQGFVDVAQVVRQLALDARLQWRTRLAQARDIKLEQQRQHR